MRKLFSLCVVVTLVLLVGCAALQNLIGQPQLQTYTFIYDGQEYSALLPGGVPSLPESAEMISNCYSWVGPLCVMHVRYVEGQFYPTVSFWFVADGRGVLGLVHHFKLDAQETHIAYIYIKGLPIKIDGKEFQAKLDGWGISPKP